MRKMYLTGQAMYYKRDIKARSRNRCCCETIIRIKNDECVCLLSRRSYTARKVHLLCDVLYCRLWPVWMYRILPHYLINGNIFGERNLEHKIRVLIFSTAFVSNISHSEKNSTRYHECRLKQVFI